MDDLNNGDVLEEHYDHGEKFVSFYKKTKKASLIVCWFVLKAKMKNLCGQKKLVALIFAFVMLKESTSKFETGWARGNTV